MIWLSVSSSKFVLPAVLRPLNRIVPLVLLNGTIPIGSCGTIAFLGNRNQRIVFVIAAAGAEQQDYCRWDEVFFHFTWNKWEFNHSS